MSLLRAVVMGPFPLSGVFGVVGPIWGWFCGPFCMFHPGGSAFLYSSDSTPLCYVWAISRVILMLLPAVHSQF